LEIVRKVRDVFNNIAEEYDKRRAMPFRVIETLSRKIPLGDNVLDAGTGNGRHIPLIMSEGGNVVAVDISTKMLGLCRSNLKAVGLYERASPVLCDISALPFREGAFTGALYSAVMHHLPSQMRRRALGEMGRVLRRNSSAILTLWSRRALKVRPDARGIDGEAASGGDFVIPWRTTRGAEDRYYHLYTAGEARRELMGSPLTLRSIFEEGLNIVAILERE